MFKKITHVLSIVLLVILSLIVVYSLASRIMGQTPSIFGYFFFRVTSDSMEPTLQVGDVLLVHSADAEDIHKDDIVTYKSKEGSMYGRDVTHRVVSDPVIKEGKYYYQTRGDAPGAPLDKAITYDQIEGKLVRKLVLIGKVYSFFCTPTGIFIFIGIIVLLFGSEMVSLFFTSKKFDATDDLLFETIEKDNSEKSKSAAEKSEKNDPSNKSE